MKYKLHSGYPLVRKAVSMVYTCLILIFLVLTGCSTTKSLGKNELLYKGAGIHVQDQKGIKKIRLEQDLQEYAQPQPNTEFLGILPLGLWLYNLAGDSVPDKGVRHWIKYKLGDKPVVYENADAGWSANDMRNYLFSNGYFDAVLTTKKIVKGRKIRIEYDIDARRRYHIRNVTFPALTDSGKADSLIILIDSLKTESLVRPGDTYDLEKLKQERVRISDDLRNRGYFNFAPDYLIFRLDSSYSDKVVDVYLDLKKDVPADVKIKYYLNSITVHADYSLENQNLPADTVNQDGNRYIFHDQFIRPGVLSGAILLTKGSPYRFSDYSTSLNKLMGLGVYKFANIRYDMPSDSTGGNDLNASVFLTRTVPRSVRLDVEGVTKSNDFAGPGLSLSYRDRNLFRGAEDFNIDLSGSYETQITSNIKGLNSWQFGLNAGLKVPRFVFPFIDVNRVLARKYTPHTTFAAGYNLYDRSSEFTLHSADLSFGYNWRETLSKSHDFQLFTLNYSKLSHTSPAFDTLLNQNPFIRESFGEQFIFGLSYRYTYNDQLKERKAVNTYFEFNGEMAGNMINLVQTLSSARTTGEKNTTVLGLPYSQYARGSLDLRFYLGGKKYNKLVNRWFVGIGVPYGNSNVLPYRKQFYTGGPNSIRAFRYRSVGPGSFSPDSSGSNIFFDQTGDIKAGGNLEYRFTIFRMLKGALFLDAGNIWLLHNEPQYAGSQGLFKWSRFFDDMAVGSGFGLRYDASFFVLRTDLGIPLRKPWLSEGRKWSIRTFDLSNPFWRRENLVLNIAIGYPF